MLMTGLKPQPISEQVEVCPCSTGILAAIACAGVSWRSPPKGISTVPAPMVESKRSTSPFWEQTFRSETREAIFSFQSEPA